MPTISKSAETNWTIDALAVRDLAVDRGGRRVFEGLSLDVPAGAGVAVTGPNGSGKSTLLRALAGLLKPTEGSVAFAGADPEAPMASHVHYVGHLDAVKTQESVQQNMAFWATWLGTPLDLDGIEAALEPLDLAHLVDLPASVLSAGQKRRLSLSRLLAAPRPVWLLDEPTGALDAASERRFCAMIERHLDAGGLVVAATHLPLDVDRLAPFAIAEAAP
ncbi:heme ABC exporter ATP-binding protein CcmA [Amorphus orientalis]|uniref:Heme exporter protein A n=1 Tax=Amorphus orientalis TaxID=649198 RepID=A0AAE4ATF6_9HYPH|nr:heme ABC exporter ATP-binding protein CcmA [Amorphus orientalis]MDQ0317231.1 heme exporter protein A [Amorphus orientalis]